MYMKSCLQISMKFIPEGSLDNLAALVKALPHHYGA